MAIENPIVELWCRKYAPTSFKKGDWLGNEDIRANFEHKKQHEIINNAFVGQPGLGKSLGAHIIARNIFPGNWRDFDMSLSGKVKNIEKDVMDFCDSGCIDGSPRKLAIFEEGDGITKPAQRALRIPMEKYAHKVVVIITCNYGSKIIDALHSRGCTINFKLAGLKDLRTFAHRIINGEGLEIDEKQVIGIIMKARGKFRNVANLIQGWTTGKKCFYNTTEDLKDQIDIFINYLKGTKNKSNFDKMVDTIERMLSEYDDRTVCLALSEYIVRSKFPQTVKTRMMIGCNATMKDLVNGVDPYSSFWSLCAEFVVILENLRS